MISSDFAWATRLPLTRLEKPVTLQLACQGSKSMINHGLNVTIDVASQQTNKYFNVASIDLYDAILGIPFLRRFKTKLDFSNTGEIQIKGRDYESGSIISQTQALPRNGIRPTPGTGA